VQERLKVNSWVDVVLHQGQKHQFFSRQAYVKVKEEVDTRQQVR
jgi:hypothetical protein